MKNILIIGANGFTGRRILNDLSVNPIYHVTGCSLRDDICPGKDYRFVRTDIRDENEVRKLFKECRPDICNQHLCPFGTGLLRNPSCRS